MNTKARKRVLNARNRSASGVIIITEENKEAENILIAKILVYSAIKIRAKGPLLYSVLNPETSSDSPSARSKGVRLVSASIVINQIKNTGAIMSIGQEIK
jgi:hypothetical protein